MDILIDNQPILSKIYNNINLNKKYAQAYLIVGNDQNQLYKYSLILSKILVCPHIFNIECKKCNICNRINLNEYSELQIVDKKEDVIKKEDIIEIKNKFSTNSIEGKNNVYIINNIDKLNASAANSILKFLEEPDSNVIAIFNTVDQDKVYNTILSRCQIIKLNNYDSISKLEKVEKITNLNEKDQNELLIFFKNIEEDNKKKLIELKDLILKKYDNKDKIKNLIMFFILVYKDSLYYKNFNNMEFFDNNDEIIEISKKCNENIMKKINLALEKLKKIEYNVNITLFMYDFIIRIGEINNEKGSRS